jgi:hypothetical protein
VWFRAQGSLGPILFISIPAGGKCCRELVTCMWRGAVIGEHPAKEWQKMALT